ncbi:replication protein H [Haloarcula sp. JP-Z28]|nr:replication protein H [Haloarcula sp. JP-Z28]NHN64322.1 replication protein H [Haloarcula sp. JP-Z28]
MTSITVRPEGSIDSTVGLRLGPDAVSSPRALNRSLWEPQTQLSDALLTALRQLLADVPRDEWRATLIEECGVTALADEIPGVGAEHHYAALAAQAADSQLQWFRLLEVSRQLGGTTSIGTHSSLADVLEGPIAILEAADVQPTLAVDVRELWDLSRTQRSSLIEFLVELSAGLDVILTNATPRVQRHLLTEFDDVLPASVTHSLESRLYGSDSVSTRTAQRRQHVRELLADRGARHEDWKRLYAVADADREQLTYDALQNHTLLEWASREALRAWVKRMADLDLVKSHGSGDRTVRLLPAGYALLDEHPDFSIDSPYVPSAGGSGRTDESQQGAGSGQRADSPGVTDPPKSQHSTVYTPTTEREEGDRPDGEAATATRGGSNTAPTVSFLDGHIHDGAVSAAAPGEIALCSRTVDSTGDSRGVSYSFLEERDEIVVEVEAAGYQVYTVVRLCAALLSEPAFQQVLTQNRLAGGPDRSGLDGLPVSDPYLLRDGGCLGYLRNEDATAEGLRSRLRDARDELLRMTTDAQGNGDDDENESLSTVMRNAHGLLGTVTRIYDMLGIDITRVLKIPDWAVEDGTRRDNLAKMIATQTAVSSRYGLYSAYRVLYEDREEKRSQLLATPDVDAADPTGDTTGSWVLAGPTVDSMRPHLEDLDDHLDLQDGADGFSAFMLNLDIVDGDRRDAVATALSRQLSLKSLKPTRETVSILHALTSGTFAAARAVFHLGGEADQPRTLTTDDLRYALSTLDVDELLPDLGPRSISEAVAILLDVDEPLATGDLADLLDVSTQTLRNNETYFADLEAAGVIQREDLGLGRATEWRICLPFDGEEGDLRTATPTPEVDTTAYGPAFSDEMAVIAEVLYELGHQEIDYGGELTLAVTGRGDRFDEWLDQHPSCRPVLSLVAHLQGMTLEKLTTGTESVRYQSPKSVVLGLDPDPTTTQASLVSSAN